MEQLSAEAVAISHHLALLLTAKHRALDRLYGGLRILVILAAAQLLVYTALGLIADR